jgi:hypothetical protein
MADCTSGIIYSPIPPTSPITHYHVKFPCHANTICEILGAFDRPSSGFIYSDTFIVRAEDMAMVVRIAHSLKPQGGPAYVELHEGEYEEWTRHDWNRVDGIRKILGFPVLVTPQAQGCVEVGD